MGALPARQHAREQLAAIGASAVRFLVELSKQGSTARGRENAIRIIADIRDPRAIRPLLDAIEEPLGSIHNAAAECLCAIGAPAANVLVVGFPNYSAARRMVAIRVLMELRDSRLPHSLSMAMTDTEPLVRRRAPEALRSLDSGVAFDFFVTCPYGP